MPAQPGTGAFTGLYGHLITTGQPEPAHSTLARISADSVSVPGSSGTQSVSTR
jgi:hypothetical protein